MGKANFNYAQSSISQLDISFSGIDLTISGKTTRFSLCSCPDFSLCPIKTLRIFCNDLQQHLELYNMSQQQMEKTLEPFCTALHLLDQCQPETVEFYLCKADRLFLYHRLIRETHLFSQAKQLTLAFGTGETYSFQQPEILLPPSLTAETLVLVLDSTISAALLRQLQAPMLRTLTLLQLPDVEDLHIAQQQTPLLRQVMLGLCRRSSGPKEEIPTICAHQFPASVKKLVIEDVNCFSPVKFSLQGGEMLEDLQTENVMIVGDSLQYGKRLKKLRFSHMDKVQLAALPCLQHCIVGEVYSLPGCTAAQDLLAPHLQTLEIEADKEDIERCIPGFFTCFATTQTGKFRPVAAHPSKPDTAFWGDERWHELQVSVDLTPSGETLTRVFTLETSSRVHRKTNYFLGTAEEKELLNRLDLDRITVTVYLCEKLKQHEDITYFGGDLCHLLRWLYTPRHIPELVLTYLPTHDSTPEWLEQFVPAVQKLSRQLQQSSFLQSIEALIFKDYFTPSPTVFSLPKLKRLHLHWDLDIDWHSARQWNTPGLKFLLLDGVKHLPDLYAVLAVFPKLEDLWLKGQRQKVLNDFFSPIPRYENICIPAQLHTLFIQYADIAGLQPDTDSQLRQLVLYNCTFDPTLLLQMYRLEKISLEFTSLTRALPVMDCCPHLRAFANLNWIPVHQLSAFADCHHLRELAINLGNCPEGDLRGTVLFLFRLRQIRKVMLYEKHWCVEDLLACCPELLLQFYPDTIGCLFGMKKYVLIGTQDTDK